MAKILYIIVTILFIVIYTSEAQTAWQADGVPVCTYGGDQMNPVIVTDLKGGGIVVWQDYRSGNYDLYAQRIDSAGNPCWANNGVAIAVSGETENEPKAISDMRGGAIAVFNRGNYNVWAQRVDSAGNACWGADGVDVSSLANSIQLNYRICSDSSGGAIITWMNNDTFSANGYDAYIQRVDSAGNLPWGPSGIVVAGGANDQGIACLIEDKKGGAIMAFGSAPSLQIYGQRVDDNGSIKWGAGGVTLCTLTVGDRSISGITADGQGGGVIVWYDLRNSPTTKGDIYAQRVDSSGNVLWQLNGVPVCTDSAQQDQPVITADGAGGALLAWYDLRSITGVQRKIYSQKIDSLGNSIWQLNGMPVCEAGGGCGWPCIIAYGAKGAMISWIDWRTGENNIYAQELDSLGTPYWTINGISVCSAAGSQSNDYYNRQNHIISDGSGGAITVWHDTRSGTDVDIYAQRLRGNVNGVNGSSTLDTIDRTNKLKIYPNPFRYFTKAFDTKPGEEIRIYDVTGRLMETSKSQTIGGRLAAGIYIITAKGFKPTKAVKIK